MKKMGSVILMVLVVFALLLLLSACSDESAGLGGTTNQSTISEGELSEREDFLLSSLTEQAFVYDYTLEDGIEEITVSVEKFEYGERQDYPFTSMSMSDLESEGSLFFALGQADFEAEEQSFSVGIQSGGSWSSGTTTDSFATDSDGMRARVSESTLSDGNDLTVTEGEVILAGVIQGDGEEGISTLTPEFYEDVDANLAEIENYETVYLFKVEFLSASSED